MDYTVKGQIRGYVQGVGYRMFIQDYAMEKGIGGWAKNLDDGSVELLLQGNREDVNKLQLIAARGPKPSNVRSLNWNIIDSSVKYQDFVIG